MPKRVLPLSAAQIAQIKPDPAKVIELIDGAVPGLRFRVTPAGTRSWSLNIRANGKMRRFEVGRNLSLSEARSKAEELKVKIKNGADPTAEKRARREKAKLALDGIGTMGSLVDWYFENGPGAHLKMIPPLYLAFPTTHRKNVYAVRPVEKCCAAFFALDCSLIH